MGGNVAQPISQIIFVDPEPYAALSRTEKYSVARLVGKLNKKVIDREKNPTLLLGPGRWGTHSPEMGVPVNFSEINHVAAIAELSYQDGSLSPDLSFGSHFFHDLIETRIFYLAIYSEYTGVVFNDKWFRALPNQLASISPLDSRFGHVVNVGDTRKLGLMLHANSLQQRVICYLGDAPGKNNPSPQT